ncbi:hypothetical protein ACA910_006663 [Epithemia clementina (nom. ined.)]
MAQIFVGHCTLVCDAYGIKYTKKFVNTLQDNICECGAMETLISDGGSALVSNKVKDILRTLLIADYQFEPYHQHQNKAENRYGTLKRWINTIMNITGCPAFCWLICLRYVCVLLNHLSSSALDGATPLQALLGMPPDITFLLLFAFWDEVYYKVDSDEPTSGSFPSSSNEKLGRWVGFATNIGDCFTWKILTNDTNQIIYRSAVRRAESTLPNLCVNPSSGESSQTSLPDTIFVRSKSDHADVSPEHSSPPMHTISPEHSSPPMHTISFDDLIGRTFLCPPEENGEQLRACVIKQVIDLDKSNQARKDNVQFLFHKDKSIADELISYNQLMEYIQQDSQAKTQGDLLFKFRAITAHQGPLESSDPHYRSSKYNVLVEWETGETTYELLSLIANDDPITCAVYGKRHGLLDEPGWKHLKRYTKTSKSLIRAAKQSRIKQTRHSVKYQFGFQIPHDYKEAVDLDNKNGNTKWQDGVELELLQISSYETFKDHGKARWENGKVTNATPGYQKIRVHLVFAVKHDGRHKARLVADGHLTKEPVETIYSGVVSICNLRITIFLAELNMLELWGADIGNAYLEALTGKKIFIIAGPEFKELKGHILIMYKALHGLKFSGARWHDRLFDVLSEMGFSPSKADPDIWLKKAPDGS